MRWLYFALACGTFSFNALFNYRISLSTITTATSTNRKKEIKITIESYWMHKNWRHTPHRFVFFFISILYVNLYFKAFCLSYIFGCTTFTLVHSSNAVKPRKVYMTEMIGVASEFYVLVKWRQKKTKKKKI